MTLTLLRHGKSDWDTGGRVDADRRLAGRGRKDARRMGRFLASTPDGPDLVVCSSARRAVETLALAVEAGGWDVPVLHDERLYGHGGAGYGPRAALDVLAEVSGAADHVLLVGHEPTWSELVQRLTGARVRFPTAAVARMSSPAEDWSGLGAAGAVLEWLVPPRVLKRAGIH